MVCPQCRCMLNTYLVLGTWKIKMNNFTTVYTIKVGGSYKMQITIFLT